jgi:glycosyltransferase involved in cell wall biosynthesis
MRTTVDRTSRQLTLGLIGSPVWSKRLGICYGWELIETLRLLRTEDVRGVLIGDGSGLTHLKQLSRRYGIEDRVQFLGRVPYDDLPAHLDRIDVCLSTQTNDLPGQVRTTGKLPLYMAAGRYVLATRVGEAARVLDDDMLVEYNGTLDPHYPERLAERIRTLLAEPERLEAGAKGIQRARTLFDYNVLVGKLRAVLKEQALSSRMEEQCATD